MHELISIKCVAWEKINGVEAATRRGGKWLPLRLVQSARRPRTKLQFVSADVRCVLKTD